jgi:hypothetical protein
VSCAAVLSRSGALEIVGFTGFSPSDYGLF